MRVNLFRPVHVKTLTSQKRRALLTARKILQDKAVAIENDIRGLLRNFGLKVGVIGVVKFDERIRELVEGMPEHVEIMEPMLAARQKLREMFTTLHRKLLSIVRRAQPTRCARPGLWRGAFVWACPAMTLAPKRQIWAHKCGFQGTKNPMPEV